jgi:tetratricopeptide (TPR) repeat protein
MSTPAQANFGHPVLLEKRSDRDRSVSTGRLAFLVLGPILPMRLLKARAAKNGEEICGAGYLEGHIQTDSRMPLLTIITPTYNRAEFLDETIESVLCENFLDLEFLVIDDGSTDQTSSVVEKFGPKITYLKHENIGESRTVNKGFRLSSAKFVMVVNADAPILPGCLARMVSSLAARPDCLAAFPDWQIIDSEANLLREIRLDGDDLESILTRGISPGPGACYRRVCFELVGYRNPQLEYSANLEYWTRLAMAGNVLHVPEVLATQRIDPAIGNAPAKGRRLVDETICALDAFSRQKLLHGRRRHPSSDAMARARFAAIFMCEDRRDAARELARSLLANPTEALACCQIQPVADVLEHFERATTSNNRGLRRPNRGRDNPAKARQYFVAALAAKNRMSGLRPAVRGLLRHPVEMLALAEQFGFERLSMHVKTLPTLGSRLAGAEVTTGEAAPAAIDTVGNVGEVNKLIKLGIFYQSLGDPDRSAAALRRSIELSNGDVWAGAYQALGISEAQRGNFERAVEDFRNCLMKDPGTPLASYQLGSCLALQGNFAEANAIFSNNIRIACGDGRFTSSIAMRLPVPDMVLDLPFRREVDLGWDGANRNAGLDELELIYFVCCDSHYLRLFGKAVAEAVARNIGLNCALHIHVVNPDVDAGDLLSALRANLDIPLFFSREDTELSHFDEYQRRTYYACARYLVLPDLRAHYELPMLVADIDMLLVKNLRGFLDAAQKSDVGLLKFQRGGYNIMAMLSASVVFINATESAREFCNALLRYLSERMQDRAAVTWHLDQAALAAVHLCLSSARYYMIPSDMMLSRIHTDHDDLRIPEEVHFWSITYSIPQNAAKLGGEYFRGFAGPAEERVVQG